MERLSRAGRDHPLLNPVLTSMLLIGAALYALHIPYERYAAAAWPISFLLTPATIALAVPLFRNAAIIRRSALPLGVALLCGSATAVLTAVLCAHVFGLPDVVLRSLAPKSVTTPVAMIVSAQIGGSPTLTAAFAIVSGVIGAMFAPMILGAKHDRRFRGFGIGIASHGIGTARALAIDVLAGTFSGLALGLNAIATALLLPPVFHLLLAWFSR
jgi:predicted murein hydrolase (TIGR00659 family)